MDKQTAITLIEKTLGQPFDETRFKEFVRNLFNEIDESKAGAWQGAYIPEAFRGQIKQVKRVGSYTDPEGTALDILTVHLHHDSALERARTMQRNYAAHFLKTRGEKEAALVAYYGDDPANWRFSLVKMEYRAYQDETSGKVKVAEELTPARRFSFLVGAEEPHHTAARQLLPIFQDDRHNPDLTSLEAAFNIETVTKEFFERYKELFLLLTEELDGLRAAHQPLQREFSRKQIETANFAKKLLGQLVFLYFLQKKGWLGVTPGQPWGSGPKNFLRRLFAGGGYDNFFNDMLEPLFYEALALPRPADLYPRLQCNIPFLNGGLFEPVQQYDWQGLDIPLPNEIFGRIFDTFDRYNFTVREDEPLEKEVAVDPEMLGKVFENLLEVTDRKSKGAFYTPREIVHYMCQESLINYLDSRLNTPTPLNPPASGGTQEKFSPLSRGEPEGGSNPSVDGEPEGGIPRADLDFLIRRGELALEHEAATQAKPAETETYRFKLPESIRVNAAALDEALAEIKICDPAIGSGAFPVGMMQEIVKARTVLTTYLPPLIPSASGNTPLNPPVDGGRSQNPPDFGGTEGGKSEGENWQTPPELWMKLKPLARQMRREPTPAENKLWQRLRNKQVLNHKFRRQHAIDRFIVDFYCRQAQLVIEVDGPTHDYTIEEDAIRQEFLESQNLRVIRFSNAEVLHNLEGVLQKIVEVVSTPLNPPVDGGRSQNPPDFGGTEGGISGELEGGERTPYNFKRHAILESIYGVDIDAGAVDVAKLRLWLSLVVDETDYRRIKPLPNLAYKIVQGNSLLGVEKNLFNLHLYDELERLKARYFDETDPAEKLRLTAEIDGLIARLTDGNRQFDFEVYFSEVFHSQGGFDVVIGNPPYVSTKGVENISKPILKKLYGFADDLYSHFFFKSFDLLKSDGILSFITSNTFLTINSKMNVRELLQHKKIIQLIKTDNVFDAMVSPAITVTKNIDTTTENYTFVFKNAIADFNEPEMYTVDISVYRNAVNSVFFPPTSFNMKFYEKYNSEINKLHKKWWTNIETSRKIKQHFKSLEAYRQQLKIGDIVLLGTLTDGGVGLQTGNNGHFVGVREGTKQAEKIRLSRPKKLLDAVMTQEIPLPIRNREDAEYFLHNKSEKEIRLLFDEVKEKYGRDIFGQGYLFRIIGADEIADLETLTAEEKENGIAETKPHYVTYDKGDKDGNRWYLENPFVIDWSVSSVKWLFDHSGKKGKGMPVVRNPQFYFKEGFCWTDVNSTYLKCRIKEAGIHDVLSMSLFALTETVPEFYIICLINSKFISEYVDDFVNNTSHFQINDARQLPIIVPNEQQLSQFKKISIEALSIKKKQFSGEITSQNAKHRLNKIQDSLDEMVYSLYDIA